MVVFWLGLTTFVTGVLVRRFELHWFDDVCNVGRPPVARPGPAVPLVPSAPAAFAAIAWQFRMQFPHSSFKPLINSIGIPTFSDVVETPPDQIACEIWEALVALLPVGTAVRPCRPGRPLV